MNVRLARFAASAGTNVTFRVTGTVTVGLPACGAEIVMLPEKVPVVSVPMIDELGWSVRIGAMLVEPAPGNTSSHVGLSVTVKSIGVEELDMTRVWSAGMAPFTW